MQIEITIEFVKNKDILQLLKSDPSYSGLSDDYIKKYAEDLVVANTIIKENIDMSRYKHSLLSDIIDSYSKIEFEEYCILDVLRENSSELSEEMKVAINSEYASESIELLFPEVEVEIVK